MNRGLSLAFVVMSLIVLAGCTVSGGGGGDGGGLTGPFPGETAESVNVAPTFTSDPVRRDVTLSAGESRLYRVDIDSTTAQNNDVVYFDALPSDPAKVTGYLEVIAYTIVGDQAQELYVSQTNEWFGRPNDPGLQSLTSSSGLSPSAIANDTPSCGGPCVVVPTPSSSGTAYIRVRALQGTVTYDLYVVATDYSDLAEPNDAPENAELVSGAFADGAVERVGDVDWYETSGSVGQVIFYGNSDLNLRANVCTLGGSCRVLLDGESRTLSTAQPVRVEVYSHEQQERAAAAAKAIYSLEFR